MRTEPRSGLGLRRLTHNVAFTLGRQVFAGVLQMVTAIVIARVLGPIGNGQYGVALLLPTMLATLLNLGIGPANAYFLGSGAVSARVAFHSTLRLLFPITAVGLVCGAVAVGGYGTVLFPGVPQSLLWVSLAIFPMSLLQSLLSSIFQGLQQFRMFNLVMTTQPVVTLVLVFALAAADAMRIELVLAGYATGYGLTVALGVWKMLAMIAAEGPARAVPGYARQAIGYGYKAHLSNILAFVNYKADIFLVNFLMNPAAAGLYTVAVSLVERLWLLSQAVSTVLLPRLSELSSQEEKRKRLTAIVCRAVVAITALTATALACVAHPILLYLFGAAYTASLSPLLFLLPGIVAGAAARVLANDIAARGRPELNMYFSVVTVVVNIVGNMLLIPLYGLDGAAIATTVAYGMNLLCRLFVSAHLTGNTWLETLVPQRGDFAMLSRLFGKRAPRQV